jgi:hypothetical protein
MRTRTFQPWSGRLKKFLGSWPGFVLAAALLPCFSNQLHAVPQVLTLGGGTLNPPNPPFYGTNDGNTWSDAQFHTPMGMALDPSGTFLFLADYDNSAIRLISDVGNHANSETVTYIPSNNVNAVVPGPTGVNHPLAVTVDAATNIFVLNHGNGTNGTIYLFSGVLMNENIFGSFGNGLLVSNLVNATAMTMDVSDNLYVTVSNNTVIRATFTTNGPVVSTVGTIATNGVSLQGIALLANGNFALTDAGNNGVWIMTPAGVATQFAGFNGPGDNLGSPSRFFAPKGISAAGNGVLVVADNGNHKVKIIDQNGVVSLLYGVSSNLWLSGGNSYPGWYDGPGASTQGSAEARLPVGVLVGPNGFVYTSEDYYQVLRQVTGTGLTPPALPAPPTPSTLTANNAFGSVTLTWSPSVGATNYYVERSHYIGGPYAIIGVTDNNTYTDFILGGSTNYYEIVAVNTSGASGPSVPVLGVSLVPPPPAPVIGWFDYEGTVQDGFFSVLHAIVLNTYNNLQSLAINPETNGVTTYYTYGTANLPSATNGTTPPPYQDGAGYGSITPLPNFGISNLVINAVNIDSYGQSSPVTTADIIYQVAAPSIIGNNAAQFQLADLTTNAQLWYTIDGTDPTLNGPTSFPVFLNSSNYANVSIVITSNVLFKVRGYCPGFLPSAVAEQAFSVSNFVANIISFGFDYGEASSTFVAAPGQTFYAPVTLSPLGGTIMYSLQFNIVATNAGPNPGPAIAPGGFGFQTMLVQPDPNDPGAYLPIFPYMFVGLASGPVNPGQLVTYNGNSFVNLETVDSALNLLAVGWVERAGATNLYNTKGQDLVAFSLAHDDLFLQSGNKIIVGGYSLQVPITATNGQTYQVQISRPSATSDGIGTPGSAVYIAAPTNGSTAGGDPINALKYITVGQIKYLAGSVYPFRWFNAGDFGSSNLVNADVEQVFQSAIYGLDTPPAGSDFFDAMDSCGFTYVDNGNGYLELNNPVANTQVLFNGDDTTINSVAFGDGTLDVSDVFVTYRRSLDPSLTWFQRYWNTNGVRVAQIVPNVITGAAQVAAKTRAPKLKSPTVATNIVAQVNFAAADVSGSAGQTIQVPITATVLGSYPLRVLMLNLTVAPLDGSPALTTPVSFTQTATVLGAPVMTDSRGNNNYAAVWLNSTNAGLTGTSTIGYLTFTIPATATTNAAYAIHFDHASASPNGLASFPKQTLTGLVTLSSRTNSSYGDGIPDAWRLRWFGTIYNLLSTSNACPAGDGVNNWSKYVAGVDPNVAKDFPSTTAAHPAAGSTTAIQWPSTSGTQYVILRSPTLFNTGWTAIATNIGTGGILQFNDTNSSKVQFYRVLISPPAP